MPNRAMTSVSSPSRTCAAPGGLGVGVEWTREYGFTANQMDMMVLEFTMRDHYTCLEETLYEGIPAWKIAVVSEAAVSGSGSLEGMPMDLVSSGTGEGVLYVTLDTVMILGGESEASMRGGVTVMGMDLPLTARSTSALIKKELNLQKGSGNPKEPVGDLSMEQVKKLAEMKLPGVNATSIKKAANEVMGVCNSMGITVNGKRAKMAIQEVNEGKHDSLFAEKSA